MCGQLFLIPYLNEYGQSHNFTFFFSWPPGQNPDHFPIPIWILLWPKSARLFFHYLCFYTTLHSHDQSVQSFQDQADFCTVCRTDCWWPLLYSWERSDTAVTVRHAGCTVADRENCRGDEVSWKDHRMSFNLFGWDSKLLMSLQSKENHPGHHLFSQLPSGRRNIKSRTTLGKSFFPWAVKTLNTLKLNAANTELTSQV